MKKIIGILVIGLLFSISMNAQPKEKDERIQSLRIAFITSKLEMTPEEAQAFWPIHNNMKKEMKQLRKEMKSPKDLADLSDKELEDLMYKNFELEAQKITIRRKYFEQYKEVLPIRKIARLQRLEKEFKKQLLERIGERRKRN